MLEIDERVQYRLQVAAGDLPVEFLGERLQVDIGGVDAAEEVLPRPIGDVARGYRDGLHTDLTAGIGDVGGVLVEDHGIVVGECDGAAAESSGRGGDRLRLRFGLQPIHLSALRDVVVLTELAREVAAGSTEGEHRRTRQEVVERLLLDRVDAETGGAAVGG